MNIHEYKKMYDIEENYWWFAAKRKILIDIVKRLTINPHGIILDVGCGTGIMVSALNKIRTAYGLDFSVDGIKFCRQRNLNRTALGNVMNLPFRDESFEVVTCFDLLEHFEDDLTAINELARVCKKGGFLITTVPAYQSLWSIHDISLHHKRRYSLSSYKKLFLEAKLNIIKISYYNTFLFPIIFVARKLRELFTRSKEIKSDFYIDIPPLFNRMFFHIFKSESKVLNFINLPFGLSILSISRK